MHCDLETLVRLSSINETTYKVELIASFFFLELFFTIHAGRSYVSIGDIMIRDHRVSLRGL